MIAGEGDDVLYIDCPGGDTVLFVSENHFASNVMYQHLKVSMIRYR